MTVWLREQGHEVNRKRVARLMRVMGIEAVYPKPQLSQPGQGHKIYPYLLEGVGVERVNQVWSTDITYIPMAQGFLYLVAVMDWFSRFVLSWGGRGRCLDNIFIERLWRSLKYEEVYLRDYALVPQARAGIGNWFRFYNHERPHQSLDYRTPAGLYLSSSEGGR